jgi:elongation factor Ts
MEISAKLVMQLRKKTNVGMMECKKALKEAKGDIELAAELLLKSGAAKAGKKSDRVANEGLLFVATAADSLSAAIVEVNCETDFVAKADAFIEFGNNIASLVLQHNVTSVVELNALTTDSGKSVADMCNILVGQLGENIQVRRAVCLKVSSGKVLSYCHAGKIASLVQIEGDNADVAKDVAMHIAALKPLALHPAGVNAEAAAKEQEIFKAQIAESGKSAEIMDKIIAGKMNKFLADNSLYGQVFVKDSKKKVSEYLAENKVVVTSFVLYEVGMSGCDVAISA